MPKKRQDGRYEIKVRISKPGEPRKYKAVYGSTLREAQERKRVLEAEVQAGIDALANPSVNNIIDDWLALKAVKNRAQTVVSYTSAMKTIREMIGTKQARTVDVPTARETIAAIAKDISPNKANRCRKLSASAWDDAIMRGILVSNPWQKVPILPYKAADKRALTDAELSAIDRADLLPMDRALISVLRYTGCRIGEAMALTTSDIDFATRTIRISKTLYNITPGPTKTKAGNRHVPMPQVLIDILTDYLTNYHPGGDILFPSRAGTYIGTSSRDKRWKAITRRIFGDDAPADFTPHIFRHTYASTLVKKQIPPTTAQLLLGHDSLRTTLQTYTHFGYQDIDTEAVRSVFDESSSNNSSNRLETTEISQCV